MAQIPQPSYPIKLWSEYNSLNNVEKNIFNAYVEAYIVLFQDLPINDYFHELMQKSALMFVYKLPTELREIERILLSIYERFEKNERLFTERVLTVDERFKELVGKYDVIREKYNIFDNQFNDLNTRFNTFRTNISRKLNNQQ